MNKWRTKLCCGLIIVITFMSPAFSILADSNVSDAKITNAISNNSSVSKNNAKKDDEIKGSPVSENMAGPSKNTAVKKDATTPATASEDTASPAKNTKGTVSANKPVPVTESFSKNRSTPTNTSPSGNNAVSANESVSENGSISKNGSVSANQPVSDNTDRLRGGLRDAGDTTWQNDFDYEYQMNDIILKRFKNEAATEVSIPSSAKISGRTYGVKVNGQELFYNCGHSLTTISFAPGVTINGDSLLIMFGNCENLTRIEFNGLDTSGVTNMGRMFEGCHCLTSLDIEGWDTSNVTNMSGMFDGCQSLTGLNLNNWDTGNVTDMSDMFMSCSNLTTPNISNWDTGNVTKMYQMFRNCRSLTTLNISNWDTSNVDSMQGMFFACESLTSISLNEWDTGSVTDMHGMFNGCNTLSNLSINNWDTSHVRFMSEMFRDCPNLTNLNLDGWDTSAVTDMEKMFKNSNGIKVLDLHSWDVGRVGNMRLFLDGCTSLEKIKTPKNVEKSVTLPYSYVEEGTSQPTYTILPMNETISRTLIRYITPQSITVSPSSNSIRVGESFTATATVSPNTAPQTVTWSSDKPAVATVDQDGKVTGITEGLATIKARTANGLEATCIVTVTAADIPATGLSIDPPSKSIIVNDEFTITATVLPDNATDKTVTWSSDKPAVATVDQNGKVKGIAEGTATIKAKTANDLEASCIVTVTNADIPVTGISVNPTTKSAAVNDEFTVTATVLPDNATDKRVTWSSSKPAVASVDTNGKVTAHSIGDAEITARSSNGLTAICKVNVSETTIPVTGITISPVKKEIYVGDEFLVNADIQPENATVKTYTLVSSAETIASVDANGKVKGISPGNAVITATSTDGGHKAQCSVIVKPRIIPVTGISMVPAKKTIYVGDTVRPSITISPANATDKSVTWSSINPSVASVDKDGMVTGLAEGTSFVVATTTDGKHEAKCEIIVIRKPSPVEYKIYIIDKRSEKIHTDKIAARLGYMDGDRYIIISDSAGSSILPLIKTDRELKDYTDKTVYDITLKDALIDGKDVTNFGICSLKLPLPPKMDINKGYVKLVSIVGGRLDKSLPYSTFTEDGIQYIRFDTDHFSDYALLYYANSEPADNTNHDHHSDSSQGTFNPIPQYLTSPVQPGRVLDTIPKTGTW